MQNLPRENELKPTLVQLIDGKTGYAPEPVDLKALEMVSMPKLQLDIILASRVEAERHRTELERLTMFLRERYYLEIADKAPQHQDTVVDAAIHYMSIERSAWRVRLRYLLAAITRIGR